ncbi:MAG: M20 family metallopeptidase [Acidaminococcaceae bacterium]
MNNIDKIRNNWEALSAEVFELRQEIHKWPELGHAEYATAARLMDFLLRHAVPVTCVGKTGLSAFIDAGREHTIALRVDIDALPIAEKTGVAFASQHKGYMHACGHDAHASIGVAIAAMAQIMKKSLPVNLKVIFQPAEECSPEGGAKEMIAEGVLDTPHIDAIMGFHVWPDYPLGEIGVRSGPIMAASDRIKLDLWGVGTHAAQPHKGIDAILMITTLMQAIYRDLPRKVDPFAWYVMSFGKLEAGTRYNVICDHASAEGTLRTFDKTLREELHHSLSDLAKNVATQYGGKANVEITRGYDSVHNDSCLTAKFIEHAQRVLGKESVHTENFPSLIGEDFSAYGKERPSLYFHLGCGCTHSLHSDCFLVDEKALAIAVELIMSFLLQYK